MRVLHCFILLVLVTSAAWAESRVTVTTDRATVAQGGQFRITVEASGNQIGDPEMPEVPGLEIAAKPIYKGSETRIVNFKVSMTKVCGYNAVAEELGEIQIPPIGVSIGGTMVYSEPVTITVVRADVPRVSDSSRKQERTLSVDDALFLKVEADKNDVYQGETVELTFSLWVLYGSKVTEYESIFPSVTGFYAVPSAPEKQGQATQVLNDIHYSVVSWRQTLFPTQTGVLELGPWRWQGRLLAPYSGEVIPLQLATDPVRIAVAPLPTPPPNFGGAVGKFEVSVTRSRDDALQGVPAKVVVSISGRGNPDAIQAPHFPAVDWAYVGDPKRTPAPDNAVDRGNVKEEFEYDVTPIQAGSFELPSIEFCYFDPELKQYVTAKSDPLDWKVLPSTEPDRQILVDQSTGNAKSVQLLQKDILPIVIDPGSITRRGSRWLAVTGVVLFPSLGYALLAAYVRRKRRFENDGHFARAYHALSRAQKRLASTTASADPLDGLFKAITGFVADSYGVPEGGLTSADTERLLRERSVDPELAAGFTKILRACERARYGTGSLSADEVHALVHGALMSMERLDALRTKGSAS